MPDIRASAPFNVAKAFGFHEICKPSAKADGNKADGNRANYNKANGNNADSNNLIHMRTTLFELNNKYLGPAAKS